MRRVFACHRAVAAAAACSALGMKMAPAAGVAMPKVIALTSPLTATPVRTYIAAGSAGPKNPRDGAYTSAETRGSKYLLDKQETLQRVMEVVKNFDKVDASKVTPASHFINDLGLDSLDVVEIVMAFEQEFVLDIPDHDAERIQSVEEAADYISQNPMAK